jgi:hypothetical protein
MCVCVCVSSKGKHCFICDDILWIALEFVDKTTLKFKKKNTLKAP